MSRLARERYLLHDPSQNYLTFDWLAQLRLCQLTTQNISYTFMFLSSNNIDNLGCTIFEDLETKTLFKT